MAVRNEDFYKKVIAVQTEYLKYEGQGITVVYIYENYIRPRFFISRCTMYKYLAINAKRDLKLFLKERELLKTKNSEHEHK